MKKNYLALILVLVLALFCFAACGNGGENPDNPDTPGTEIPNPDVPTHTCESVCAECGKCLDASCTEDACKDKCAGHIPEPKIYTIIWNVAGKVTTEEYKEGQIPSYSGSTAKASDKQYSYTFTGWSPAITAVDGTATYTAQYSQEVNKYKVTWIVDGKSTVQTYEYGATPSYTGSLTKPEDNEYKYTFNGWDKTVSKVTGDVTYTAKFTATAVAKYKITWVVDGVKKSVLVAHGVVPSYKGTYGTDPHKESAQFSYTFLGWTLTDSDSATVIPLSPATADATYYAKFSRTERKYTITWKIPSSATSSTNNKSVTSKEAWGETPSYPDNTLPVRNGYYFMGWKDSDGHTYSITSLPVVEKDTTYEAVWVTTSPMNVFISIDDDLVYSVNNFNGLAGALTLTPGYLKLMKTAAGEFLYIDMAAKKVYTVVGFTCVQTGDTVALTSATTSVSFPITVDGARYEADIEYVNTYSGNAVTWMKSTEELISFEYDLPNGTTPTPPVASYSWSLVPGQAYGGSISVLNNSYDTYYAVIAGSVITPPSTTQYAVNLWANNQIYSSSTYNAGSTVVLPTTINGQTVTSWVSYNPVASYTPGQVVTVNSHLTLYATLAGSVTPPSGTTYLIALFANGQMVGQQNLALNAQFTLPSTVLVSGSYKTVTSWSLSTGGNYNPGQSVYVTGNMTFTATLAGSTPSVTNYTIAWKNADKSNARVDTLASGSAFPTAPSISVPAGKKLVGWTTVENGTTAETLPATVTRSLVLFPVLQDIDDNKVTFTFVTYSITGVVTNNPFVVDKVGNAATVAVTDSYTADRYTKDGKTYKFVGWDDGYSLDLIPTAELNGKQYRDDMTFTATYEEVIFYSVDFRVGGVSVAGYPKSLEVGTAIVAPSETPVKAADSASYYSFSGWRNTSNNTLISDGSFGNVTANVVYDAEFGVAGVSVMIRFIPNNGTAATVLYYAPGATIAAPANPTPPQGQVFKGWSTDGSTVATITTATANVDYTALYEAAPAE